MKDPDSETVRAELAGRGPNLWAEISALAEEWLAPVLAALNEGTSHNLFPKTINDPVWGTVEIFPWEKLLLDSPLLQRLRGVRQLGMAYCVYPGAGHCRLEHTLGVVEAADRMIRSLERNARHRRQFGNDRDDLIPLPDNMDIKSTRLAALLHDLGHAPFSHVTELLLRERYSDEFGRLEELLLFTFPGATNVANAEIVAVLLVMSEAMRKVLEHPGFGAEVSAPGQLPTAIAAHILGSRLCLSAGYLSGVISGPLDADKLDYMAHDSYHAGLPLGLSLNRLISKLEVVTISPENAMNKQLQLRAEAMPNRRFYEIGISLSGLSAYEQMIIGRVILYDRLYYHHKVRAAEAMVRRLISLTEEEIGRLLTLTELYHRASDDCMMALLSAQLKSGSFPAGGLRSKLLGEQLLNRRIYHRAFAFAGRFISTPNCDSPDAERDMQQLLWPPVLGAVETTGGSNALAREIFEVALKLRAAIPNIGPTGDAFHPEHVLVDLPLNRPVVSGGDIPTRTEGGYLGSPNLYFDPERWSQAYQQQKQCGFVFTPRKFVPLVALASRIVFFEKFDLTMVGAADHAAKTVGIVRPEWIRMAVDAGICSEKCFKALAARRVRRVAIKENELRFPSSWRNSDPEVGCDFPTASRTRCLTE